METEVENLASCSMWLEPKIVVPALCVLVASVAVPLLLHFLKEKRERENKIIEIRTKAYTEYFKKYEDIAKGVGHDYEQFSKVTLIDEFKKLLEGNNSPDAIVKFNEAVGDFPHKIQDSHRKASEEVTVLNILGSSQLLELTNEFEAKMKDILSLSSRWLSESNQVLQSPEMDTPIAREMTLKGRQIKVLKDRIIAQMRKEINLE